MTPKQCMEARGLLGWSHYRLAGLTRLPESFVQVFIRTGRAGVDAHKPRLRGWLLHAVCLSGRRCVRNWGTGSA